MKNKIPLEEIILEVLANNYDDGNAFMSDGEIAYQCMGLLYEKGIKRKTIITPIAVRARMSKVRESADDQGITIVSERMIEPAIDEKTKKVLYERKGWKVKRWRIAGEEDEGYIKREIELRLERSDNLSVVAKRIQETAIRKGLIGKPETKKIES